MESETFMRNKVCFLGKTIVLMAVMVLSTCMTVFAAPAVKGDTELKVTADEVVTAEYTITNDADIEHVELTLTYDKDALTYMTGSGGNNYVGNGGNGLVLLTSNPGSSSADFTVKFKGKTDGDTEIAIQSCVITVDGKEIDVLTGEELSEGEEGEDPEDEEEEEGQTASWVIDGRTFFLARPGAMEDFEVDHIQIQGKRSRVLKHVDLDLYVIYLNSDNGSYRDYFVYNPDTGNIVPYFQCWSGTDLIWFLEPDENVPAPVRYVYVDMPWGAKYTVPAYKHVIIDGIDQFYDDNNRYLVYGMNQKGEKAWYDYDYDLNSIQKFDEIMYNGEQAYIMELEESANGQKEEAEHLRERYNTNMGRRLTIIMVMLLIIIVLLNALVMMYMKLRKLSRTPDGGNESEEEEETSISSRNSFVTGSLEENETDFQEPTVQDEIELEIIDLNDEEEE